MINQQDIVDPLGTSRVQLTTLEGLERAGRNPLTERNHAISDSAQFLGLGRDGQRQRIARHGPRHLGPGQDVRQVRSPHGRGDAEAEPGLPIAAQRVVGRADRGRR